MKEDLRAYRSAVLMLVGTIIGVGIFGVPYVFSRVGLLPAAGYLIVLTGVQLLQHLFYAEAAIACPVPLRLVGLVDRYLGRWGKHVAAVSIILGFWGAILAYMVVGGTFLHILLSPYFGGSELTYQIAWAFVAATVVFFGLTFVTRVGVIATSSLLAAMAVIFVIGIPHINVANYLPLWTGHDWLLPYGIVLFSLSGLPAILEMEDILRGRHAHYRSAVIAGTLIAATITGAFGFVVWGVTGAGTTTAAIVGLQKAIGPGVAVFGALLGFLAVITSFFSSAINLENTFRFDYGLKRAAAWLLTFGPPFALMLLGAKNFVNIVGFTGAVFSGTSAIMVALLYIAVTKHHEVHEKPLGIPIWTAYVSIAVLATGALLTVATTLEKVL
jgi:amino acid permease